MKCIILAAGYATRLYPITKNFPKPLLDIKGKTIIDWLIDDIDSIGVISEYIIVSNHKFIDSFNNWYKEKNMPNIHILDDGSMSNDKRLGAVVDIIYAINELNIDEDLLIIAGDNVLDFSLSILIDYYKKKNKSVVMRYYEESLEKIKKGSCALFDNDDKLLEMYEKPSNPVSHWCVPPFYIYTKDDVKKIMKAVDEGCSKDTPGSLVSWLCHQSDIYIMEMPGKRYDIGNIKSYEEVKRLYKGINNK